MFKFIDMDGPNSNFEHGSRVTIMADNGRYWQADGGAGHYVSAKSSRPKTWEIFKLHRLDDGEKAARQICFVWIVVFFLLTFVYFRKSRF